MPKNRRHANAKRDSIQDYSNRATRSTQLPPQVLRSVPQCAYQCLGRYINQNFNCSNRDFSCLCTRYSANGFSLGELAYLCLAQACGQESSQVARAAYGICDSRAQAVRPTHKTLTLAATTASKLHSSTGPLHTATSTTKHDTHGPTSSPSTSTGMSAAGVTQSRTSSPSANTDASNAKSSASPATHLTSAQSAGISIAAMGAVMLAIGIIYLIAFIKRRKVTRKDERKEYDFIDEAPPRISPVNYCYTDPRGVLGGFQKRQAELTAEKRTDQWPGQSFSAPAMNWHHEKGFDSSPETYQSMESKRSQLLPDKPFSTLKPFTKSPALTTTTIFEEDGEREEVPLVPRTKPLPKLPPAGQAIYYPPPPPLKPRNPQNGEQFARSPEKARQPSLSLSIPKQAVRLPRIPPPAAFPIPSGGIHPAHRRREISDESKSKSTGSEGSLLNYYTSPEAGCDASPDVDEPVTPIDDQFQQRKGVSGAITVTKPAMPSRAVRADSVASDTSFETNCTDEPTPPEELERQLTPVPESADSPISGLRYPKIPRSSNQAVARSPVQKASPGANPPPPRIIKPVDVYAARRAERQRQQQQQQQQQHSAESQQNPLTPQRNGTNSSTLSGSTLAAKRVGNSAAQDLGRRLYIGSNHSRANSNTTMSGRNSDQSVHQPGNRNAKAESPLKGYGRSTSGRRKVSHGRNNPEMKSPGPQFVNASGEVTLKSPLWEPKLTPSRKGADLYLNVGLASPMTAAFTPMRDSFAH